MKVVVLGYGEHENVKLSAVSLQSVQLSHGDRKVTSTA